MAYNNFIDRTGASATIPEETSNEIIQALPQASAIMPLATKLPNMSRKQLRIPVLASLPIASFRDGDTGLIQTSNMTWENVFLNAEFLDVFVPIANAVLEDSDYDLWGQIKPRIVEAMAKAIDAAVLFGVKKPALWCDAIFTGATNKGSVVTLGATPDYVADISSLMAKIEEDGYEVNGFLAPITTKAKLRDLKDSTGRPLYIDSLTKGTPGTLHGSPITYLKNGAYDASKAVMLAGDFSQLVYAMRSDISYKMIDQGVISDETGKVVLNLAQQDMVALKVSMRLGFALPNPINAQNPDAATRYPFAVLAPHTV